MKMTTPGVEASAPAAEAGKDPRNLLRMMDLENCLGARNEQRRLFASTMVYRCRRGVVQTEVAFDGAAATAASAVNVVHEN